jgi:oligopeptide transport system substrate-binding protein
MTLDRLKQGVVVLLALFLVAGWGGAAAETVIRMGNGAECGTLDPQRFNTVPENNVIQSLYEGLTIVAPGGAIAPGQAEKWSVSPDGLTWTFTLRPELHWSNGDPLTAEDFVYSLRRLVDPATAADNAFLLESLVNSVEINHGQEKDLTKLGVAAPDPRTLVITLKVSELALPRILVSIRPSHRGSVEAAGREAFKPGAMVSNGAYRLVEWQQQARMVLAKNPHYWDAAHVQIDRVEFYPIDDPNEEMKRYRAGDLDLTQTIPSDQYTFVKETLGSEYHVGPQFGVYYLGFNQSQPPFKDNPKLRLALTLAIDRQLLADKVALGYTAADGWIPTGVSGYPNPTGPWVGLSKAEREAKAKQAYQEAGYGPDHPLQVELSYNTSENHKKIMIAIAGMWKQLLGVETHLSNQEFKTFIDTRRAKKTTQAFRAAYLAFYQDPGPLLDVLRPQSPRNDLGYVSDAFEAAYRSGVEATDPALRLANLAKAETLMLEDMPVAPLFHYTAQHLIKPYVQGWQPSPLDSFLVKDMSIAAQ